jgi:hypothetical protein
VRPGAGPAAASHAGKRARPKPSLWGYTALAATRAALLLASGVALLSGCGGLVEALLGTGAGAGPGLQAGAFRRGVLALGASVWGLHALGSARAAAAALAEDA